MPTPKYVDSPHAVQTSLFGYDRSKKVQFQINNLRGKPIVVLRSDERRSHPRPWVDRSHQMPKNMDKMYPSYTHFHHQYSNKPPRSLPGSPRIDIPPFLFHERFRRPPLLPPPPPPILPPPPSSPLTPEEEVTVRRLFDKLEVLSPPITSDITILELNPKIAAKKFGTTSLCSTSSSSFQPDTPKSLSDSRRTSCSSDDSEGEGEEQEEPKNGHSCPDEAQCITFRNGICLDDRKERKSMLQWYDDLLQWRHDVITRRRFGPPHCPPPPLTITMIGASRAQRANPFQRIGDIHPFAMEAMDHARRRQDAKRQLRLIPAELPLPAPHEFMANAKCMEPHLFVEYCYQLTAAAYLDSGLTPPHRRPPIPPRIEPIPEQQTCRESICSSASEISSDGEYSDDSDDTRQERLRQKIERHRKRENRLQKLFRRRQQKTLLDEIDEEED
uniref:PEHE domain-containing protein n=1 Tax=Caenorhabditis tropicalis TaxID=1561998 RepID=A0A1I7TF61_9PELO